MDVESIKAIFQPCERLARELEAMARSMEGEPVDRLLDFAVELVGDTAEFRALLRSRLEPVPHPGVSFSCNRCGRCCDAFTIGVSIDDVERFMQRKHAWILPFVTLSEERPTFRFMNVAMLAGIRHIYPPALIEALLRVNPSLDHMITNGGPGCIFHDDKAGRCTIHGIHPLECRLYPVANLLVHEQNILCDPSTFTSAGTPVDDAFTSAFDANRVSDVAFSALYNLNPGGGWRASVFKLALVFHELAHAVDPPGRDRHARRPL